MTKSLEDSPRLANVRARGRILAPLACLSAALGTLIVTSSEPNELSAAGQSRLGPDFDFDGLADAMELILKTSPDNPDTDLDGYHDIEEVARGSDPLDALSVPGSKPLSVGMYAYTENGNLNLHTALYVEGGDLANLDFELGVVIGGKRFVVSEALYASGARWFFYGSPSNVEDVILVGEMPIPVTTAQRKQRLSVYSMLRDGATAAARPSAVDITDLEEVGGEIVEIIPAPQSIKGGTGIVYRPISTNGSAPTNSVTGQICWQNIVAVGTDGASILYEIDDASCEDFDSQCSGADCSGSVGKGLSLPSAGALLGG